MVTAVGPGAAGPAGPIEVGAGVIAFRAPGAYAAELVVPASALVPKPDTLDWAQASGLMLTGVRSEERRVGKECRSRWSPYH